MNDVNRPRIELQLTAAGYGSKIVVDGIELRGVRRAEVVATPGAAPAVTVELVGLSGVFITGEACQFRSRIRLWPTAKAWLIQLWDDVRARF